MEEKFNKGGGFNPPDTASIEEQIEAAKQEMMKAKEGYQEALTNFDLSQSTETLSIPEKIKSVRLELEDVNHQLVSLDKALTTAKKEFQQAKKEEAVILTDVKVSKASYKAAKTLLKDENLKLKSHLQAGDRFGLPYHIAKEVKLTKDNMAIDREGTLFNLEVAVIEQLDRLGLAEFKSASKQEQYKKIKSQESYLKTKGKELEHYLKRLKEKEKIQNDLKQKVENAEKRYRIAVLTLEQLNRLLP